ncbi:hypothetical protein SASPL_126967 [Salvia splendens]|uniref:Protein FAR1-RELATED SEQUENCE n=1 Tax=Salvia splendens TaxID=180675 RepID=A0A8X8XKH3_SALSN|nr:hypothetical protein SASPL_126967 [Salvia splendens]
MAYEAQAAVIPDCRPELKPYVGQVFETLEDGISFYEAYAKDCRFDTRRFRDTVPSVSSMDKAQRIENLYGASRPSVVNVHPPNVVSTKGSGSSSGKRIASATEKAIILQNKPKRRCAKCREMGHHDARNCGREKGKSKM